MQNPDLEKGLLLFPLFGIKFRIAEHWEQTFSQARIMRRFSAGTRTRISRAPGLWERRLRQSADAAGPGPAVGKGASAPKM